MFKIKDNDGKARAGELATAHGKVKTPFFMPVATKAVTKFIDAKDFENSKTQCIISNAFVLYLAPGTGILEKRGGIHKFMNFGGSIFTDSGGFQMYSQKFLLSRNKDGVKFRDPINGGEVFVTPEKDMEIQLKIGSDVAMCLDDMPKCGAGRSRVIDSIKKTIDWAKRCKKFHDEQRESYGSGKKRQLLFGIAQGGVYPELREKSAQQISELDFDGIAFGGLALGEPAKEMFDAVNAGMKHMPEDKPKYLMGLGTPWEIANAVGHGIDCFDSRYPTMNARHGLLFTMNEHVKIDDKKHAGDEGPIEEGCDCYTCRNFSKAYIHHLSRAKAPTGMRLKTLHNIRFMARFMERIRESIKKGEFEEIMKKWAKK